jgi:hypothetical protein
MFTQYVSAGQAEDALRRRFGLRTENEYRAFLQHNPQRVLAELRRMAVTPVYAPPAVPLRR